MLDYNILMLVHPSSSEHTFYKVKDANSIIFIDSFSNEPKKENRENYALIKKWNVYKLCLPIVVEHSLFTLEPKMDFYKDYWIVNTLRLLLFFGECKLNCVKLQ